MFVVLFVLNSTLIKSFDLIVQYIEICCHNIAISYIYFKFTFKFVAHGSKCLMFVVLFGMPS